MTQCTVLAEHAVFELNAATALPVELAIRHTHRIPWLVDVLADTALLRTEAAIGINVPFASFAGYMLLGEVFARLDFPALEAREAFVACVLRNAFEVLEINHLDVVRDESGWI